MGDNSITSQIPQAIQQSLQDGGNVPLQLVETIAVLLLLGLARSLVKRFLSKRIEDNSTRYSWRKNINYLLTFLAILVIGRIWVEGIGSIATYLGLLSAGIAIALRGPLTDIAGWTFILSQKTFSVGDRIQIGSIKGDVIDIRMMKFSLLEIGNWVHADQSTGRVVHIPNHKIFDEDVYNYTADFEFIWNEIPILVTFESDWRKAKQIIEEVAQQLMQDFTRTAQNEVRKASQSYLIHFQHLTPIVYTSVEADGVKLTLRHLTNPRRRRSLNQAVWERILDRFGAEETIEFAYPTTRFYTSVQQQAPPKS
jgi:small-conductance mechanosensitive channel